MVVSLLIGGSICLCLVIGARVFLSILGESYAEASVDAMRVLALGLLPFIVLQSYNAVCRATDRTTEGTLLGAAVMAAICAGTAVFGQGGTLAVAMVWVLSTSAGAAWAIWRLHRILDDPELASERAPRSVDG
jgi:O-antigen/teichoic acid export membrane protein